MGTGFVPAGQLKAGDRIVTEKGIAVKLDAARYTGQRKTVYNIEVADDHTYFVGKADGGVWVHNAFICGNAGTIDAAVANKWNPGTFADITDNIEYHFGKHGNGQTLEQYTQEAQDFFNTNRSQAQWGQWNPKWQPSYRLKIGGQGGYFDAAGNVLTYWK